MDYDKKLTRKEVSKLNYIDQWVYVIKHGKDDHPFKDEDQSEDGSNQGGA